MNPRVFGDVFGPYVLSERNSSGSHIPPEVTSPQAVKLWMDLGKEE
jgi:hypothetical protein